MITRFAPSPTGPLHLGHAFSAITAHDMAMEQGGTFLLRIEDIDQTRARAAWEAQIYDDLEWLGLSWETPVMRQSERQAAYSAALETLWQHHYAYPCDCTRRDIMQAASAPQGEPTIGPDGVVYPGTCRPRKTAAKNDDKAHNLKPHDPTSAYRLDMTYATRMAAETGQRETGNAHILFNETGPSRTTEAATSPSHMVDKVGDVVLARRGWGTSYHLSVVVDDAAQGITHVTRGEDLFEATAIHVVLQRLLGLPTPTYHHHRLIRDETGRRLAKRDDARAIALYRKEGATPADIRHMVGL